MTRFFLLLSFLLLATPAFAAQGGMVNAECRVAGYYTNPNKMNEADIPLCPSAAREFGFTAAHLEPGQAANPVDAYGQCYYFDNSSEESMLVPLRSADEYISFVNNLPEKINRVQCCRAMAATSSCNGTVILSEGRSGETQKKNVGEALARVDQYQCSGGEWKLVWHNTTPCNGAPDPEAAIEATFGVQGWATERNFKDKPRSWD